MAEGGGSKDEIPNDMRDKLEDIFKKAGIAGVAAGIEIAKQKKEPITSKQIIQEIREGVPPSKRGRPKKQLVEAYIEEAGKNE
jgi:hypothetical protein